ncbi:MAG: hypothetical protein GY856_43495 [bacterium]|nr:hypothetical protein [bacterium]
MTHLTAPDLPDPDARDRLAEEWEIRRDPDFEGAMITAAIYGSTVHEATAARLLELAAGAHRDAEAAVRLLVDAVLAGFDELSGRLAGRVLDLVRTDGDFVRLTTALGHLL